MVLHGNVERRRDVNHGSVHIASHVKSDSRSLVFRNRRRLLYGGIFILSMVVFEISYFRGYSVFSQSSEDESDASELIIRDLNRFKNQSNRIRIHSSNQNLSNSKIVLKIDTNKNQSNLSSIKNAKVNAEQNKTIRETIHLNTIDQFTNLGSIKEEITKLSNPETTSNQSSEEKNFTNPTINNKIFTKMSQNMQTSFSLDLSLLFPFLKSSEPTLKPKIGLLNFAKPSISAWKLALPTHTFRPIRYDPIPTNITWIDLFPPYISEPNYKACPLPHPLVWAHKLTSFDSIVARIPCREEDKDKDKSVRKHYLTLLTAASLYKSKLEEVPILILSKCRPTPNLFHCSELKHSTNSSWLYVVNKERMIQRLSVPVGSCVYALGFEKEGLLKPRFNKSKEREAYATVLHSDERYVCGAMALAQSIRRSGSSRDLILLLDDHVSAEKRQALRSVGWILHDIQRIRSPNAVAEAYNEWNYSKLRLWQLVRYERVIFLDADVLVFRNMDHLFDLPELSASGNGEKYYFNSGVMVMEPSQCMFDYLMERTKDVVSYNGGDQGFLNEVFTYWNRLPYEINFLKHISQNDAGDVKFKNEIFESHPPKIYAIHFLGEKPWTCYKDYDCNWLLSSQFASDSVHEKWWNVFESLPPHLHRHCWLNNGRKAHLEFYRLHSKKMKKKDLHWNRTIMDPRLEYCLTPPKCEWLYKVNYMKLHI